MFVWILFALSSHAFESTGCETGIARGKMVQKI